MRDIDVRCSADGMGLGGYSPKGTHRFWFHLDLDDPTPEHLIHQDGLPLLDEYTFVWIGLNPSTSDDDGKRRATLDRVARIARGQSATRLLGLNLYPYRATSPKALKEHVREFGSRTPQDIVNDEVLEVATHSTLPVLTCWGGSGVLDGRGAAVLDRLPYTARIGTTRHGQPWHPLQRSGAPVFEVIGIPNAGPS